MNSIKPSLQNYLNRLSFCLSKCDQAHKEYLNRGQTYDQSKNIEKHNKALNRLAISAPADTPKPVLLFLEKLQEHLGFWHNQYKECEFYFKPKGTDVFVFDTIITFPSFEYQRAVIHIRPRTIIIAEAGVNHCGDIDMARKLIECAADAGADYVKFQAFTADSLSTCHAKKADYQIKNTKPIQSQKAMLKELELSFESHYLLKDYADKIGIGFLTSPFDCSGIDLVEELELDFLKIPSGEATNYLYLKRAATFDRDVILSTGMCTSDEVQSAISVLIENGLDPERLIVLHCTTEYPAPFDSLNLRSIPYMCDMLSARVGYSDHSLGIEASVSAVSLGASIIEKHLTLDANLPGPDHSASLEPIEFARMVNAIRNIELALGEYLKQPSSCEIKNIPIARKSLVALDFIKKGDLFTVSNLGAKRPGTGISPMLISDYLGTKSLRNYFPDELIDQ